jgi:predicted TPR repeat methyltransferase
MTNEASMVHKRQGDQYVAQGALDQAARCYALATEADPSHADAFLNLGYVQLESNHLPAARRALEQARALAPQVADVHFLLGELASREDRLDDAVVHYSAALERNDHFDFAYRSLFTVLVRRKAFADAVLLMRRAVAASPQSVEFAFNLANALEANGEPDKAIRHFTDVIARNPDVPQFHHNLANVYVKLARDDEAAGAFSKALSLDPDFIPARIGMGHAMLKRSAGDDAGFHFRRALEVDPANADATIGLAAALELSGKADEGTDRLQKAVAVAPADARLRHALGAHLLRRHDRDGGMDQVRRAVELDPEFADAFMTMGNAHLDKGDKDLALACFRRVLALQPESGAAHLVAMLEGASPERAPSEYVAKLFDQYADRFDTHLVKVLSYSVPDQIVAMIREAVASDPQTWRVLDLGCGTGLIATALGPGVGHLVGVDLSGNMLAKARTLDVYDRLEQAELVAMMQAEPAQAYTLAIAADVLVYFGSIEALLREARRVLAPGGILAFSVEELAAPPSGATTASPSPDFLLRDTGRYAHTWPYIERLAAECGFTVNAMKRIDVRVNLGKPVPGMLVVLRS